MTVRMYGLDGYRIMSSITKLMGNAVCPFLPLENIAKIMDVGGNSGEFLLQLLRCPGAEKNLQGRVVDSDFIRPHGLLNLRYEEPQWYQRGRIGYIPHNVCVDHSKTMD